MNFTNQELVQELQKRIKAGEIEMEVTADQFKKETNSLLSLFGTKELLFLTGLTILTILVALYSIKATSS